jgi:ketosteroid isomerase-like protein
VTPRKGGASIKRSGDVLSLLQKQAGRWVIVRDANMLSRVET